MATQSSSRSIAVTDLYLPGVIWAGFLEEVAFGAGTWRMKKAERKACFWKLAWSIGEKVDK
jgi:hypothetical protein